MAVLNPNTGFIQARCRTCAGALTSFSTFAPNGSPLASVRVPGPPAKVEHQYCLYRCTGCGHGALARVMVPIGGNHGMTLASFEPEPIEAMPLPTAVPAGIVFEFREGEQCLQARCARAAAGMFRSVLDKTLRSNGYKLKTGTTLEQQIDLAVKDGVITQARSQRAHEDVRVLGNDVLHDEWREIPEADVLLARHYAQRILEDLYDDRPAVLQLLKTAGRHADDMI